MKKPAPRNLKSSDGQTMVEFALVLPLLAMLLFSVIALAVLVALGLLSGNISKVLNSIADAI